MDRIEAGALPEGSSDPVILLVREASGDEEVGAAGANLKGVILCHSLPHLSHLGELLYQNYSWQCSRCAVLTVKLQQGLHTPVNGALAKVPECTVCMRMSFQTTITRYSRATAYRSLPLPSRS